MIRRRPLMPGYGTNEGDAGLLDWSWAVERLTRSHDYWVATVHPDGRPNVTPVWGVWLDEAVWFSCSHGSRKARNLAADPRCTITTDDAQEPVIVEGVAAPASDYERFTEVVEAKYASGSTVEFFAANALFRVVPAKVLALTEADFGGSPTCWDAG